MSKMKRYLEDLAYKYLEKHPEMSFEEAVENIVSGKLEEFKKEEE